MLAEGPNDSSKAVTPLYWTIRHQLARIRFLRSSYFLVLSILEAMLDSPLLAKNELNNEFSAREDPWDYAKASFQIDRIRHEVAMLEAVRSPSGFQKALEVGCAEGLFTAHLAPLCQALLAADISSVALERTQRRLSGQNHVDVLLWDLRNDPAPEGCDLIVIIHALEYVRNPLQIRKAREKLVKCLRPGGYLLIGTMKVAEIYETAWWGCFMLRSGQQINRFFARHPALKVTRTEEIKLGENHLAYDILLQKQS